jgi:hypothetical protein
MRKSIRRCSNVELDLPLSSYADIIPFVFNEQCKHFEL